MCVEQCCCGNCTQSWLKMNKKICKWIWKVQYSLQGHFGEDRGIDRVRNGLGCETAVWWKENYIWKHISTVIWLFSSWGTILVSQKINKKINSSHFILKIVKLHFFLSPSLIVIFIAAFCSTFQYFFEWKELWRPLLTVHYVEVV